MSDQTKTAAFTAEQRQEIAAILLHGRHAPTRAAVDALLTAHDRLRDALEAIRKMPTYAAHTSSGVYGATMYLFAADAHAIIDRALPPEGA